ncbi:MAG: FGGY family carbohydrate kinase [Alistipes sp.]
MEQYILSLDQGTSSSRAIVFDRKGQICSMAQREFTQIFPKPGWVEHNPHEIWSSQASVIAEAIAAIDINGLNIAGIASPTSARRRSCGTAKRRNRSTTPSCGRTAGPQVLRLAEGRRKNRVDPRTGLIIDAYFSATKIKWILDNVPGARAGEKGKLMFGTVDSWLIWRLTRGEVHVTDVSNASRTMLFNIHTLQWDEELLRLFGIPASMMPQVKSSSEVYGATKTTIFAHKVPIAGIAGDQQAALFGQMCVEPGSVKNTYGTGCFLLMNSGEKPITSSNNLLTTIAWKIGDKVDYALEGSIFVGGSVVQWLRDGLGIIRSSSEVEALAASVPDTNGVYFVPALTGLAAPYWDQYARGAISGISRGTTAAHIRPRGAGGDRLPDAGHRGRHAARLGHHAPGAEGRRRRGEQQPADAVPVRPAGHARHTPGRDGNHGAGCGLPGRTGRRLLGKHRRNPAAMAGGARIRTHGRPLADREGRRRVGRRRTQGTAQQQRLKDRDYGNHTVYQVPVRIHRDTGARTAGRRGRRIDGTETIERF